VECLAGLYKRQTVVKGLTKVERVEARANKQSADLHIQLNNFTLWGSAVSQQETELEF